MATKSSEKSGSGMIFSLVWVDYLQDRNLVESCSSTDDHERTRLRSGSNSATQALLPEQMND
jgi:hypothetical protein